MPEIISAAFPRPNPGQGRAGKIRGPVLNSNLKKD
jgi:hypothetical protein